MTRGATVHGVLLAFDTSGAVGSVAVGRGREVMVEASLGAPGQHASRLVPVIEKVLGDAGLTPRSLDGIVVGEGPGSFTGVRVAAATAKGLAAALTLPVWAVSSLLGAALGVDAHPFRYALFDAREDRVYGACYGVGRSGVQTLAPPHAGVLREVLDGDVPPGTVFVGDGAERHRAAIEAVGYRVLAAAQGSVSVAVGLLRYLAAHRDTPQLSDLSAWEPSYLREPILGGPWRP